MKPPSKNSTLDVVTLWNGKECMQLLRVPLATRDGRVLHIGLMPLAHKPLSILALNGANYPDQEIGNETPFCISFNHTPCEPTPPGS